MYIFVVAKYLLLFGIMSGNSQYAKAKKIRLIVTDVDGVLTNGQIIYNERGEESKVFNVKDGLGIRLVMKFGFQVAVITGRKSEIVSRRCEELGIQMVYQGIKDKAMVLREILSISGHRLDETAYIGDDLNDLNALLGVGFKCCPEDAHQEIRLISDYITAAKGGEGCFRELADLLLEAQGLNEEVLNLFKDQPDAN